MSSIDVLWLLRDKDGMVSPRHPAILHGQQEAGL